MSAGAPTVRGAPQVAVQSGYVGVLVAAVAAAGVGIDVASASGIVLDEWSGVATLVSDVQTLAEVRFLLDKVHFPHPCSHSVRNDASDGGDLHVVSIATAELAVSVAACSATPSACSQAGCV